MASWLDRLRASAQKYVLDDVLVDRIDLTCLLSARDDLDAENDDLRRENERLLKAVGECAPTLRPEPQLSDMCCGGTCVRAVCFIHGGGDHG